MRICVYAASSAHCEAVYQSAARHLGFLLAEAGATIVYGGGGTGLMGAVADGALDAGGHVIGIDNAIIHAPFTGRNVEVDFISKSRVNSVRFGNPMG